MYKFFSFLHHSGVSMVEGQEVRYAWTSQAAKASHNRDATTSG